jgi:hypothetical protein
MFLPPVWAIALVLAAAAPWGVHALQRMLERRQRVRTLEFLAHLPPAPREPHDGGDP